MNQSEAEADSETCEAYRSAFVSGAENDDTNMNVITTSHTSAARSEPAR